MVVIAISTTASIMAVTRHFPGGTLRIATGELAKHNHNAACSTDGNHNHTVSSVITSGSDQNAGAGGSNYWSDRTTSTNGAHSHTITINATGNNQAHENRQPYTSVNRWKRTA